MKVSDSSQAEYTRKLDEKITNQNRSKEAELEGLKKIYDKKIEAAKADGEERYASSLQRNSDLIVGASKDYEDKLNDYKQNLERTQKNLSKEEVALKMDHESKTKNARDQFLNNLNDQFINANEVEQSVHDQSKNNIQLLTDKARTEKNHLETKARTEMNALANDYNQKGVSEEKNFRARLEQDIRAHEEEEVRLQKSELKSIMDKDTEKSKRLESEKMQVQKEELTYLDNHQKDLIAQKQADFKVRYEAIVKEHDAILSELKTHLDTDIKKMIESTSTQKRMIASKNDDQFYRVETLNPVVNETEKEYIVSLKVPEHEKENVHLSVHGRDVKMTLTRKYSEMLEAEDGSSNKSTRTELFSKEFSSKDILNPKVISQKYENGELLFKIQKL